MHPPWESQLFYNLSLKRLIWKRNVTNSDDNESEMEVPYGLLIYN